MKVLICCIVQLRHEETYDKWRLDIQYKWRVESNLLGWFRLLIFPHCFFCLFPLSLTFSAYFIPIFFVFSNFPLSMLYHEVIFLPISLYLILPYNFTIFRLSYSEKFLVVFILIENCVFSCTIICFPSLLFTVQIRNINYSDSLFLRFSLIFITLSRETNVCVKTLDNSRSLLSSCRGRIFAQHTLWSFHFYFSWQPVATGRNTRHVSQILSLFFLLPYSSLLLTFDYSLGYCFILLFQFQLCIFFVFESLCCLICARKLQNMRICLLYW